MRIIYRIIDKNDSDNDCLYKLDRDPDNGILYWIFMRYTTGDLDYPTIYLTNSRNVNPGIQGLSASLTFEEGDLCGDF